MYEKNKNIKQIRKIDKFRKIFVLTIIALLLISSVLPIVSSDTIYPYDLGDLEKTLDFQDDVYSVAFSQNNNWLAVGGYDKGVKIYNVSDWSIHTSISSSDTVTSVAFSPDNNWLAVGCWYPNNVYVYNASDWSLNQTLTDPTNVVYSVAFSLGSNWLAVGCRDSNVYVYNVSDWSLNQTLTQAANYVYSVDFSQDGNWLAAGSWDENVRIYKVSDWSLNKTLTNPTDSVNSVAFSQNNNWLAAGDLSLTSPKVYIWKVSDWSLNKTLTDATSRIKSVAFSQNNNWLAVGSQDNSVRIYKVSDWSLNKTLTDATSWINSVAFSQNNNWLAAGGNDNQVRIYRGSLPIIRITNVSPVDRATGVSLNPTLNIQANHSSSSTINITWNTNESGSWVTFNTTTNVNNGTYSATNTSWVNNYKTDYWWNVSITDDQGNCSQQTFHFTTGGSLTVLTNASTGIEETNATLQGYLQDDGGESCTVRFEYGTNTSFGTNTSDQIKNTGDEFSAGINSLIIGQLYHYRAYANNTFGSDAGNDMIFLTKPQAPASLTAQSNNSNTIYLTWTKGIGANNTYIERYNSQNWARGTGSEIYNGTGTNYENRGLTEGTKYYYQAWSYTTWTYDTTTLNQWSDVNASANNKTKNKPTITNPGPSNGSTNIQLIPQMNITINDLDGDNMNITWYSNSSGSWVAFGTNTSCDNGTYHQTNSNFSSYGNKYWWYVKVTDGTDTNTSAIFHFTTTAGPITVRTNISTGIEETNATLQGYLQDDGGESCTVRFEYGTTTSYGTNTTNQTKNTGNKFNTNIDSLTKGQLYHYRAYANNSEGSNTGSDKTLLTKPDAPTNLTATAQSTSQIDLTWTPGDGANKTHIRRKTGSYPNNITDGTQIYNDTGTSYSDTGLSASTKYYYRAWSYTKWTYGSTTLHQWSDENNSNISTTTSSSGGGGGGYIPPPIPPISDGEEEPLTTREQIENLYNITLNQNFYANDTNGDGINDTFTDPNGILNAEHLITINEHTSFLISVNNDLDKLFIWDTEADTITQVTHSNGTITDTVTDTKNNTITVTVTINKNNWTYIEVTDKYPDITDLTVKTSDGRNISSDMIWRENSKIFVLDDPAVEYLFIYSYESEDFLFDVILELTTDSVIIGESINALITLINVGEPGLVNGTVIYNLSKDGSIIWSDEEGVSVLGQKVFSKTISTEELSAGEYTYEVVYSYGDDQTASSSKTFTINAQPPLEKNPRGFIFALMVVIIIVVIIIILFKTGYLNLEEKGEKQNGKKIKELDKKHRDSR